MKFADPCRHDVCSWLLQLVGLLAAVKLQTLLYFPPQQSTEFGVVPQFIDLCIWYLPNLHLLKGSLRSTLQVSWRVSVFSDNKKH